MSSPPLPPITRADIERLLGFLPRLRALVRESGPIGELRGGGRLRDGAIEGFWFEYPDVVHEFFHAAGSAPWSDYGYDPSSAGRLVEEPGRIEKASLEEIRTMLTWCTRGERFCDGHWAHVLSNGTVVRLLERLGKLATSGSPRTQ